MKEKNKKKHESRCQNCIEMGYNRYSHVCSEAYHEKGERKNEDTHCASNRTLPLAVIHLFRSYTVDLSSLHSDISLPYGTLIFCVKKPNKKSITISQARLSSSSSQLEDNAPFCCYTHLYSFSFVENSRILLVRLHTLLSSHLS
jgi:hypothetical protein